MGLLDSLLGGATGGTAYGQGQGQSPLLQIALQLLQQNGGIEGILARCQQAGYGAQAQSWIGTGQNMPIDASALSRILGGGQLGQLAQQFGMSHDEVASGMARTLPNVVDQMTPSGQIPGDHNDLVNEALAILQRGKQ
jgi:uncharacterized protein YidB (DUF937 family)